MTIAEARDKCKKLLAKKWPRDLVILVVLLLSVLLAFGLGYLAGEGAGQGSGVALEQDFSTSSSTGHYVASSGGTKYYLPWCSGAARISAANKIYFVTETDAQAAGYAPAADCKGL